MKKIFTVLAILLLTSCSINKNSSSSCSSSDYTSKELDVVITYSSSGALSGKLTNKSEYLLAYVRKASFTCKADNNYEITVNAVNSPSTVEYLAQDETFSFQVEDYRMSGKWTDGKSHTYKLDKVNKGTFSYGPKKGNGTLNSDYVITWGKVERVDRYTFKQYFTPKHFDIKMTGNPVIYPVYSKQYGVQGAVHYNKLDKETLYKKGREYVITLSFTQEDFSSVNNIDYIDSFEYKMICDVGYKVNFIGVVAYLAYINGEEKILGRQEGVPGAQITVPETPVVEGYKFKGWYSDKELTKLFNFEQFMIEGIIDVFGKFERN